MENEVFIEKDEKPVQTNGNADSDDVEIKEETKQSDDSSEEKFTAVEIEDVPNTEGGVTNSTEEDVITTQPTSYPVSPYEDVYRSGNFGITLGKVNQPRGLKWAFAHMGLTSLMLLFTVIGTGLVSEYYNSKILRDLALGFTWTNSLFGVISGLLTVHFFRNLKKLRRPYAILMTVRFLAIFNWILLMFSFIFVLIIVVSQGPKAYPGAAITTAITKAVFGIIAAIAVIELVVSFTFVCSPAMSELCEMCSCCGPCCIYSKGEEIAPGVPNPPSQERWEMVALILYQVHKELNE